MRAGAQQDPSQQTLQLPAKLSVFATGKQGNLETVRRVNTTLTNAKVCGVRPLPMHLLTSKDCQQSPGYFPPGAGHCLSYPFHG